MGSAMRSLGLVLVLATSLAAGPVFAKEAPRHGVVAATRELFKAWQDVRRIQRGGATGSELGHARARLTEKRAALCKRLGMAPALQLLKGAFVDGPQELICAVKKHPFRTVAILVGAVGVCTAAGMAGLPIDAIALCASAGLTVKVMASNWHKVTAAFKRHSRTRWRTVGEDLVFPAAAFAAGLGMGAAVEGATQTLGSAAGPLGVGLKSTAQSVDDLVPITEVLGGEHKPAPKHKPH